MKVIIIAAHDNNLVIGNKNSIPWNISEEMKHFKRQTLNNVVIMGYNTYISLKNKPLKNRDNVVISRNFSDVNADNFIHFNSLKSALGHFSTLCYTKVFIIGGEKIYKEALELAEKKYNGYEYEAIISNINDEYEGDTYFPSDIMSDFQNWQLIKSEIFYKDDIPDSKEQKGLLYKNNILFDVSYYKRK